jgi:predicted DCC family thiol-disulfide oxidoreductase YuxK
MASLSSSSVIVYFDGYCNLCNGFVDFLIRRDHQRRLKFASLQGSTAKQRLPASLSEDLFSVVCEIDGKISVQSSAAIYALSSLGGGYRLLRGLLWVPRFIRDSIYAVVAAHRYSWFGRRDTCRLPTPEERQQFLD